MRTDYPPFRSPQMDETFLAKLREAKIKLRDDDLALRDIAVVGALISNAGEIRGHDLNMIVTACKNLSDAGIPVHPEPNLRIYNLLPPVQSDFLAAADEISFEPYKVLPEDKRTDLLVTCYVPGFLAAQASVFMLHPSQEKGFDDFSRLYRDYEHYMLDRLAAVSPYQENPSFWEIAADLHNARFVSTYGGSQDEICSNHFNKQGLYNVLIETDENYSKGYYGGSSGSFAYMVQPDHEQAVKKLANDNNLLGQRLMSPVNERPTAQNVGKLRR